MILALTPPLRRDGFQALRAKVTLLHQAQLSLLLPPPPLRPLQHNKLSDHLWQQILKISQTPIWNLWFAR